MCVLVAPRKWYLWLFISFRGAIKYSLYPQSSETNEPRLRSNRSWQIFLNNVYLLTVTFTSLRRVPLACDFHCLKPGSVSSAGISFSLRKTLQNFASVCFSSSAHPQIWTRKRRREGEMKVGDTGKTLYTSSYKQEKVKDKGRKEINIQDRSGA